MPETLESLSSAALSAYALDGKVAVVTGAASGIGKATAELFAAVGARVAVVDLDLAGAEAVAERINATGAREAVGLQADISDELSVLRAFGGVAERLGALDVLVNNAAYRPKRAFLDMTPDEWDRMHAVNARGTFLCMQTAIRAMLEAGAGGSIVNVSSVSAKHPTIFNNTHYDSSKAGVDAMTRITALEFAYAGIRVNSVQPGGTATEGQKKIIAAGGGGPSRGPMALEGRRPMERQAEPIELARAILFLASPAASYVTGHHLTVDGGFAVS